MTEIFSQILIKTIYSARLSNWTVKFESERNIKLNFFTNKNEAIAISVYAVDGKILFSKIEDFSAGSYYIQIPLSGLKNGIYVVKIVSKSEKITRKLIL